MTDLTSIASQEVTDTEILQETAGAAESANPTNVESSTLTNVTKEDFRESLPLQRDIYLDVP